MIVRDVAAEFLDDEQSIPVGERREASSGRRAQGLSRVCVQAEARAAAARLAARGGGAELDAGGLRAALRREWRACLGARPSLALCRALVPLRDRALAGAMRARDLPALLALLAYWRHAFRRLGGARRCGGGAVSSYRLRALLWAAGVTASNKVLECLVLRFARGTQLTEEAYIMALARLHLAHGACPPPRCPLPVMILKLQRRVVFVSDRYRSLDTKMKVNPLSLEEVCSASHDVPHLFYDRLLSDVFVADDPDDDLLVMRAARCHTPFYDVVDYCFLLSVI